MADYRIYVACLASYNNGRLHGAWIDVDGKDGDDIREEVAAMLRASPYPNVMVQCPDCEGAGTIDGEKCPRAECDGGGEVRSAEEWAIHDHEGFGNMVKEYTSFEDVATIAAALGGDHAIGFRWLVQDHGCDISTAAESAAEVIVWEGDQGQSRKRLLGDYAQEFTEETGGLDGVPESFRNYIDWESMAHDWDLDGDIATFDHDGTIYVICNPRDF